MSWDFGNQVFSVPKECKQDIELLFNDFKYQISLESLNDNFLKIEKNLARKDILLRDYWYSVLTRLKDNGYAFSSYVEKRYKWYEQEHKKLEEERRILAEKIKEKQEKELKKEESQYAWLCVKYDSLTNLEYCRKCKYNTKYNLDCCAKKIKIK